MDDYPYDLGPYTRKITTASPAAQLWFVRGLNWCCPADPDRMREPHPRGGAALRVEYDLVHGPAFQHPLSTVAYCQPGSLGAIGRSGCSAQAALTSQ